MMIMARRSARAGIRANVAFLAPQVLLPIFVQLLRRIWDTKKTDHPILQNSMIVPIACEFLLFLLLLRATYITELAVGYPMTVQKFNLGAHPRQVADKGGCNQLSPEKTP